MAPPPVPPRRRGLCAPAGAGARLGAAAARLRALAGANQARVRPWLAVLALAGAAGALSWAMVSFIAVILNARFDLADGYFDGGNVAGGAFAAAGIAAALVLPAAAGVVALAPLAGGSGLPEIAVFLNGATVEGALHFRTLVVKVLGICLVIAAGVPVGREGPMVFVGGGLAWHIGRVLMPLSFRRKQYVIEGRSELSRLEEEERAEKADLRPDQEGSKRNAKDDMRPSNERELQVEESSLDSTSKFSGRLRPRQPPPPPSPRPPAARRADKPEEGRDRPPRCDALLRRMPTTTVVPAAVSDGGVTRVYADTIQIPEDERRLVSYGGAAGVAAAFNALVGGVLYIIEEMSSWWDKPMTFRAFVGSSLAAFVVVLLLTATEGRVPASGLTIFSTQSRNAEPESDWQLKDIPWIVILGAAGGVVSAAFSHAAILITAWRRRARWRRRAIVKVVEAVLHCAVVVLLINVIPLAGQCREVVHTDVHDHHRQFVQYTCEPVVGADGKPHEAYNDLATLYLKGEEGAIRQLFARDSTETIFSPGTLVIFFFTYLALSVSVFGLPIPMGHFVPMLLSGAALGRLMGQGVQAIYGSGDYGDQHSPGAYAEIGAAAFLGGFTRMSIAITVLLVEATRDVSVLLPQTLAIIVARLCAWLVLRKSFNEVVLDLKKVGFLHEKPEPAMRNQRASDVMARVARGGNGGTVHVLASTMRVTALRRVLRLAPRQVVFPVVKAIATDHPDARAGRGARGLSEQPHQQHAHGGLVGIVYRSRVLRRLNETVVQLRDEGLASDDIRRANVNLAADVDHAPYVVSVRAPLHRVQRLHRRLRLQHVVVVNTDGSPAGIIGRKQLLEGEKRKVFHRSVDAAVAGAAVVHDATKLNGKENGPPRADPHHAVPTTDRTSSKAQLLMIQESDEDERPKEVAKTEKATPLFPRAHAAHAGGAVLSLAQAAPAAGAHAAAAASAAVTAAGEAVVLDMRQAVRDARAAAVPPGANGVAAADAALVTDALREASHFDDMHCASDAEEDAEDVVVDESEMLLYSLSSDRGLRTESSSGSALVPRRFSMPSVSSPGLQALAEAGAGSTPVRRVPSVLHTEKIGALELGELDASGSGSEQNTILAQREAENRRLPLAQLFRAASMAALDRKGKAKAPTEEEELSKLEEWSTDDETDTESAASQRSTSSGVITSATEVEPANNSRDESGDSDAVTFHQPADRATTPAAPVSTDANDGDTLGDPAPTATEGELTRATSAEAREQAARNEPLAPAVDTRWLDESALAQDELPPEQAINAPRGATEGTEIARAAASDDARAHAIESATSDDGGRPRS